ncbi:MAG TPA: hypothetical protein VGR02_04135 [Thermoanaerobaculia bacterium]|nr:hypothetical protein [Thermoanaerobaculia bacterium]
MEEPEMNITCNQLDDLLLEGDAFSLETAARHAAGCPSCARTLAGWNDLSSTARSLHATWENDMLWPRIDRTLRAERGASRGRLWQVAAALLLTAGLGGFIWRSYDKERDFNAVIIKDSKVEAVEDAERAHQRAIAELERLTDPKLEQASTPLMISYKEKLMLLDDAIAECDSNIKLNQQNAHLRRQLLALYSEKQSTLKDVLREDAHGSNH